MDTFSLAETLKIAGTFISILFGFFKLTREYPSIGRRRSKEHESLDFISSFLAFDITNRNRFVVEHAFEIYFKNKLSFEEIRALLNMQNPLTATRLYIRAKQHIEFDSTEFKFKYKKGVQTEAHRQLTKVASFVGYFIFALAGFFMFFFFGEIIAGEPPFLYFPLLFLMFVTFYLAYLFLNDGAAIDIAKRFIKEAEKEKT